MRTLTYKILFILSMAMVLSTHTFATPPSEEDRRDLPSNVFDRRNVPVPTLAPGNARDFIQFFVDMFDSNDAPAGGTDGISPCAPNCAEGEFPQFAYNFPADDEFFAYGGSTKSNPALNEIFNEVATHVGIPAKYLRAVMSRECPTTFSLSAEEVKRYSDPGGEVPFCIDADPPNYSDGPMQFLDSTWSAFANAVNIYGGYTHEPSVLNIRDSVYGAAMLLKENVLISEQGTTTGNWTRQDVVNAVGCYATGRCKRQVSYDSLAPVFRKYVDNIWDYLSK